MPAADPTWSPDGTRVAFTEWATGSIYVVDADGRRLRRVTDGPKDGNPTWSPDGTRIAFTSVRVDAKPIYTVNADGTDLTRLTDGNWEWELDWYIPPSARAVSAVGKRPFAWGWLKGGARRSVAE